MATPPNTLEHHAIGRDNNFNLLRMLAAMGVLISHAYPIPLGPKAAQPLETTLGGLTLGTVSVYVFFVISGFFIARSYDRTRSWQAFLSARALRLFPALAGVLLLTVLIASVWLTTVSQGTFWAAAPQYLIRNVTLFSLKYELPGVFTENPLGPAINGSLWTLSYEVICYAGVFLLGLAGLLGHRILMVALVVGGLAAYAASPAFQHHDRLYNIVTLSLPFVIGAASYAWRAYITLRVWPILLLGGVALVLRLLSAEHSWAEPLFQTAFVLALCYIVFVIGFWPVDVLRGYNRLGDYSYGIYIYAFPAQQFVAHLGVQTPLMNMCAAFLVALPCAILSWHLVEAPALNIKASIAEPKTRSPLG